MATHLFGNSACIEINMTAESFCQTDISSYKPSARIIINVTIDTLAIDRWVVTFSTATRGMAVWLAQTHLRCTCIAYNNNNNNNNKINNNNNIIIIIIKNEKIRVTLCENAVGALYIVNVCWWSEKCARVKQIHDNILSN